MADPIAIPEARPPCPTCGYLADATAGAVNFCPKCGQDLRPGASDGAHPASLLGHLVADRYKLIALLGEGGMGAVYKAEHVRMGKALAVKILRGDFARDPAAVERFRAEARIVSRLSHPHTIAVFDFGEIEALGGFYLAMEYVPGHDLAHVVREQGRFDEARAAEIGQQILGSLAEAHEAGIVHRDMKPGNVMVMQARPGEDFAKVLDFGIAKLRDEVSSGQTSAGAIVGTPNYLAPEQARGEPVDARADLYAVGCLLYELLAGHPPFAGRAPMAVVNAHLHEEPPPLSSVAPGVSHRYAALVHKALAKRPADRFASADEMREALLALGEPTASRTLQRFGPQVTGELTIARREDFEEFEEQVRALRRGRVAAPLAALAIVMAAVALIWRWGDVYGALAGRAPDLAAKLPAALRPADRFDGEEHEPNGTAAQANPLPIPPGPAGELAGGVAQIHGTVGARQSATTGDVDVYRIVIPPLRTAKSLSAEWHAEGSLDGIRGLDVTLSLNRERPAEGGHASAPLVASADRGGPGRPERLLCAVEPGTYYLTVREQHDEATGPVEKPTDRYVLEVQLVDPRPGEEVEPNDAPESGGARAQRYPEWRALAERNALTEAVPITAETGPGDADTFALPAAATGRAPGLLLLLPDAGVALRAEVWVPDAQDLAPGAMDRQRFAPAGDAGPGELLALPLPAAPADGPALLRVVAPSGTGRYLVLALGAGPASSSAALARVQAFADAGSLPAALELAAAVARHLPHSAGRADVLTLAGHLAEAAEGRLVPDALPRFDRAARILGSPVFERDGEAFRYRAAFEQRVEGKGPVAEEAALRALRLAGACAPAGVADRVEAFVARFPGSRRLPEVRLWRARALEAALFEGGWSDTPLRRQATAAWEKISRGPAADEARAALLRLKARTPPAAAPRPVCPDPGAP
jgi:serine/threonine-protein kinase